MAEQNCLFCSIINRAIPASICGENESVLAFHDINPMAPNHILVIPKLHLTSINDLTEKNAHVLGEMALMAKEIARKLHVDQTGYRFVINTERGAGQTVFHLHAHVLAGRDFSWPPG